MAAAYSELPGKCLLVLQSASCGQAEGSGSGGGEVEIVDSRQVGLGEEGYFPAGAAVLRAGGLARTYSSISLAGFTLLSSGSTSEAGHQAPPRHTPHTTPPCRRLHRGRARRADLQQRRGHPWRHRHQLQQVGHPALPPAHRLEIQVSIMMMMMMIMMMMVMIIMMTVATPSTLLASSL